MSERLDFVYGERDDYKDIFRIAETTGWGETLNDIKRYLRNPHHKYILLVNPEGVVIAVTLTVTYGEIGFIGHVIVEPEMQGMGIGQEIMIEATNYLLHSGCKTIKLDAVEKARTLYERVGYLFELNSLRYFLDVSTEKRREQYKEKRREYTKKFPVHNVKEDDLAEILNADEEMFGCNREGLLKILFEEFSEYAFISKDTDDFLAGYSFGVVENKILRIRAGLSDSLETTINLIDAAILTALERDEIEGVSIGMVENAKWGIKAMDALGFNKTSFSLRMYTGDKTEGTINPAYFAIGHPAKG